MNKITAIVLAAGSGSRMKSKTKKQFMEIKGKPVIWYSLFEFEKSRVDEIILVTGKEDIDYCKKEIVEKYNLKKIKNVVAEIHILKYLRLCSKTLKFLLFRYGRIFQ